MKHGRGVYQYADGGRFEGEFSNGARNGIGIRIWTHGRVKVRAHWAWLCNGHPTAESSLKSVRFLQSCSGFTTCSARMLVREA